jgi:hypothetical protein
MVDLFLKLGIGAGGRDTFDRERCFMEAVGCLVLLQETGAMIHRERAASLACWLAASKVATLMLGECVGFAGLGH